jgi:cathepsin A (carboxypeptidase C)
MYGPLQQVPVNPYDVRRPCNRNGEDGPLCYKEMEWVATCVLMNSGLDPDKELMRRGRYMNRPEVKKELGVPSNLDFETCSSKVYQSFQMTGGSS